MPADKWPGLITNASPFAIPHTAAVEQTNLQCTVPGQISVRGGMQKVNVAGGAPDILDCFPCEIGGKPAIIAMMPGGALDRKSTSLNSSHSSVSRMPSSA